MAKVVSVVACEDTAVSYGGRLILVNLFRDVTAAEYPARADRLKVVVTWLCRGETVQERVIILDPDGEPIAEADADFAAPMLHTHIAGFDGLVLPGEGEYLIRVYDGAALAAELPLVAIAIPPPEEET